MKSEYSQQQEGVYCLFGLSCWYQHEEWKMCGTDVELKFELELSPDSSSSLSSVRASDDVASSSGTRA